MNLKFLLCVLLLLPQGLAGMQATKPRLLLGGQAEYEQLFGVKLSTFLRTMDYIRYFETRDFSGFKFFEDKPLLAALKSLCISYKITEALERDTVRAELLIIDLCHWILTHRNLVLLHKNDGKKLSGLFEMVRKQQFQLTTSSEEVPDIELEPHECGVAEEVIQAFGFIGSARQFNARQNKDARSNKLAVGDVSQSSVVMFKKLIYVLYNMGAHARLSIEEVASRSDIEILDYMPLLRAFIKHLSEGGMQAVEMMELAHKWHFKSVFYMILHVIQEQNDPKLDEALAKELPIYFLADFIQQADNVPYILRLLNFKLKDEEFRKVLQDQTSDERRTFDQFVLIFINNLRRLPLYDEKLDPFLKEELRKCLLRRYDIVTEEPFEILFEWVSLGEFFYAQKDYENAHIFFALACKEYNGVKTLTWARARLCVMYRNGLGCVQDFKKAYEYGQRIQSKEKKPPVCLDQIKSLISDQPAIWTSRGSFKPYDPVEMRNFDTSVMAIACEAKIDALQEIRDRMTQEAFDAKFPKSPVQTSEEAAESSEPEDHEIDIPQMEANSTRKPPKEQEEKAKERSKESDVPKVKAVKGASQVNEHQSPAITASLTKIQISYQQACEKAMREEEAEAAAMALANTKITKEVAKIKAFTLLAKLQAYATNLQARKDAEEKKRVQEYALKRAVLLEVFKERLAILERSEKEPSREKKKPILLAALKSVQEQLKKEQDKEHNTSTIYWIALEAAMNSRMNELGGGWSCVVS